MQNNGNLEIARWTLIGRLTASLFHEINNPMQAIHGAMALALEELDTPESVEAYVNLSQREAQRVIDLIQQVREIYRPQSNQPEPFYLHQHLATDLTIIRKELNRQKIQLIPDVTPELPPITAVPNQIRLLIFGAFLALSETMGAAGGGQLQFSAQADGRFLRLNFAGETAKLITPHPLTSYFLEMCQHLTAQSGGRFSPHLSPPPLTLKITLPFHHPT